MTRHKCFVCGAWRNGYCIKVTPLTHASIEAVLRAQGRDTEVTMGGHVCRETCYTDEMVERHKAIAEAGKHVGKPVARLSDSGQELGAVMSISQLPRRGTEALFKVEWRPSAGGEPFEETLSLAELEVPESWGAVIEQQACPCVIEEPKSDGMGEGGACPFGFGELAVISIDLSPSLVCSLLDNTHPPRVNLR